MDGFYRLPSVTSITHFGHTSSLLESLNSDIKRAISTHDRNVVSSTERASVKNNIDRLAHTNFVLHLENGSFSRPKCIGKAIFKETLSQSYSNREEVLQSFTFLSRHWNEWEGFPEIFDLIVAFKVDAMF